MCKVACAFVALELFSLLEAKAAWITNIAQMITLQYHLEKIAEREKCIGGRDVACMHFWDPVRGMQIVCV